MKHPLETRVTREEFNKAIRSTNDFDSLPFINNEIYFISKNFGPVLKADEYFKLLEQKWTEQEEPSIPSQEAQDNAEIYSISRQIYIEDAERQTRADEAFDLAESFLEAAKKRGYWYHP